MLSIQTFLSPFTKALDGSASIITSEVTVYSDRNWVGRGRTIRHEASHGLITLRPQPAKPRKSRVTISAPQARATAAIMRSAVAVGRPAGLRVANSLAYRPAAVVEWQDPPVKVIGENRPGRGFENTTAGAKTNSSSCRQGVNSGCRWTTLATERALPLTRAGLSPVGSDQFILTHPHKIACSRCRR
ncbi:MAG: hypothetical protein QOF90_3462 [Acetobacteraceae bacterium]|jgi:hypothetical protein|nr:hypothetical protein [Acetobacteraceae bacterium]